jgi:hypothetical protein
MGHPPLFQGVVLKGDGVVDVGWRVLKRSHINSMRIGQKITMETNHADFEVRFPGLPA